MKIPNFYLAVSALVGTIVGVGIFGLPYLASKAGFFVSLFWLALLTVVSVILHLFYGEIILKTQGDHRFPGYVRYYFGNFWGDASAVSVVFGSWVAQLVYIIVGAQFLDLALNGFLKLPLEWWALIFFFFGSLLIYLDIARVAKGEFILNAGLILIIFILFFLSLSKIKLANFSGVSWPDFFLPYGATLFALSGIIGVAEVKDVLKGNMALFKKAIVYGTVISALISFLFLITVLGVSGLFTTEEAIKGLQLFFGNFFISFLAVFGVLAVFTSYLISGLNLKKVFWYDYSAPKLPSFFLAVLPPLIIYFLSFKSFVEIISFAGTILLGFDSFLLLFLYQKVRAKGFFLIIFTTIILIFGIISYLFL